MGKTSVKLCYQTDNFGLHRIPLKEFFLVIHKTCKNILTKLKNR